MRTLASIQKVLAVDPIAGADQIEVASVLGWKCVVRKGEFKPGDLGVYCEIDSLIPIQPWSDFLKDKNKPEKPARLRTIRLRGQLSQGLLVSLNILAGLIDFPFKEGDDVTNILGITKYEPVIPVHLCGEVKGCFPGYVPKTDETRLQSFPDLIKEFEGKEVYATQKINGTSMTVVYKDGEVDVCGRNWSLKDFGDNTYWSVVKAGDLINKLKQLSESTGQNYAIQGELYGEGIQKNPLKIKGRQLAVFNVFNINEGRYLDYDEFVLFCDQLQLEKVPLLYRGEMKWHTVEELLEFAKGTYASGAQQEGIVIRPVKEARSEILDARASFKVINDLYLEKGGE